MSKFFVHESSFVDEGASIGDGTKIWHFCHIFPGAQIAENCSFGQNCVVSNNVKIGRNVKVQNNVSIYEGTELEDDVFLGPSCVLTNVTNPRSQVTRRNLYEKTTLKKGCTVGANATVVCGVTLGRYSFVAAGAVVTKSIPDYALVQGVPAKQVGWMSRHGHLLETKNEEGLFICPESKLRYQLDEKKSVLKCLDLDEEDDLPESLSVGSKSYTTFKS